MKILVTCKRVPNPEHKLKISAGKIDLASASWQLNTFDEYAVETALRLTEAGKGGARSGEVSRIHVVILSALPSCMTTLTTSPARSAPATAGGSRKSPAR